MRSASILFTATLLLLSGALPPAASAAVYQCKAADGGSTYQDLPCDGSADEKAYPVRTTPPGAQAPTLAEDPYGARRRSETQARNNRPSATATRETRRAVASTRRSTVEPSATRCTDTRGNMSYSHSGSCPKTHSRKRNPPNRESHRGYPRGAGARAGAGYRAEPMKAERVSQKTACADIRAGRARSNLSSYEKNTGRDPCS